jgi:putative ATP-dependent endonuclease of OLD family
MNILIDTVRICGFRGIHDLEISIPRVMVLVGANNSGKTSVIKAMQLALGDYSRHLSDEDFYIDTAGKRSMEIVIDLRIIPVEAGEIRVQTFNSEWAIVFGDRIRSEASGYQYLPMRTRINPNLINGGYDCFRYTLQSWPNFIEWKSNKLKEIQLPGRYQNIQFIGIEAQRDLCSELREKASFIGKLLASIQYNNTDEITLEDLIEKMNSEAISKSDELSSLKVHLEKLNHSFGGNGITEVSPYPKKLRDFTKNFSVYFGKNESNMFSMEYHGMGTRSWASLLTVKAFIELTETRYKKESEPFFPIMAAEEPEAHLHPNAQKTLYKQLSDINGQVIVSTHSPYLASMTNPLHLRSLSISDSGCLVRQLTKMDEEDLRKLERQVIHSRGDILFSKALILCEGETEEQSLPLLFQKFFSDSAYDFNISFVGVGGSGKRYLPFLLFARDYAIPLFVFSDGESTTRTGLKNTWDSVFGGDVDLDNCSQITILGDTDFEGYLIKNGFSEVIEKAIMNIEETTFIERWIKSKNATSSGREKTDKPRCSTCNQEIYEDVFRDYTSEHGRDRAIHDILDVGKTKYAPEIAKELCELEKDGLPPKIIEFFEKLNRGLENA